MSKTNGIFQKEIDIFPYLKRCTLDIVCGKYKKLLWKQKTFENEGVSILISLEAAMGIQVDAQLQDSPYIMAVQR